MQRCFPFFATRVETRFFFLGNRGVRVRQYVRVIIRGDIFPSNGRDAIRVWQLVAYTRESVFQKKKGKKKKLSLYNIYIYIYKCKCILLYIDIILLTPVCRV